MLYEMLYSFGLGLSFKRFETFRVYFYCFVGNGFISFQEFKDIVGVRSGTDETVERAFKAIDVDGSGLISPDELQMALAVLGEDLTKKETYKLIRMFDFNMDGQIDIKGKLPLALLKP